MPAIQNKPDRNLSNLCNMKNGHTTTQAPNPINHTIKQNLENVLKNHHKAALNKPELSKLLG